ncbi:PREDICTED: protein FAM150A [Leptosomus discolor]|uniref:protein FAM150A n=1 Tax=Leptosomus discolor TaxID=188344 RepID=UPI000522B998|nr:PREDICTED: protein FAM150A [Leptosomus discolor]
MILPLLQSFSQQQGIPSYNTFFECSVFAMLEFWEDQVDLSYSPVNALGMLISLRLSEQLISRVHFVLRELEGLLLDGVNGKPRKLHSQSRKHRLRRGVVEPPGVDLDYAKSRKIFPRDSSLKDKFIKHFTGPVTFSSECSKHFHRLYHNTRDCSTPAYYKRCARLLTRLAMSPLCTQS